MAKKVIRFEPSVGAYLVMCGSQAYSFSRDNMAEILSEIGEYSLIENKDVPSGAYSMPIRVQIQATRKCNLRCVTCGVANGYAGKDMTYEEVDMVIRLLAESGVLSVEWSGGEPLVRPDFWKLVETVSRRGMSQFLLTNGTLFTHENASLAKKNFETIQVSIDGTGEIFNKIVGRDIWNNFVRSLSVAVREGIENINAATVLQKDNVHEIANVLRFCSENGIKNVRISPLVPIGRSSHITWGEYGKVIDEFESSEWYNVKNLSEKLGVKVNCFLEKEVCYDESVADVGSLISPGGCSFLYIDASGIMYPFPFLVFPEFRLGDALKDSMRNVWFNSDILNLLRNQTYKNTGCGDCRLECSFAERSLVYAFTGRIDGPAMKHRNCPKERRW